MLHRCFVSSLVIPGLVLVASLGLQPAWATFSYQGCTDLTASDFKETVIVDQSNDPTLEEPVGLYVAKDGKVYFTERASTANRSGIGKLKMYDPANKQVSVVATLNVENGQSMSASNGNEQGLRSVTLDPHFDQNKWVYLYYATAPSVGAYNRVSRFTMTSGGTLDMNSEKPLLQMPWTYTICCHQGGGMDWSDEGDLFVSTGNNTENSNNFAPMDPSVPTADNQGRTANTMDWRGKILRIHPDSSTKGYSVPNGNLRQMLTALGVTGEDTNKVLPEIYTFGHRNPYSLSYDRVNHWLLWGDVGPDNITTSSQGPIGNDEFNLVKGPGFQGWPYFVGANLGYPMWDAATSSYDLPAQNPNSIVNNSPNNKGINKLPPAQPCILPEPKVGGPANLGAGTGTTAIAGPMYHYDGSNPSRTKMPPHFDGKWFIAEFTKNWFKVATPNAAGTAITDVQDFPLNVSKKNIIDVKLGPDGALYLLNYSGWFNNDGGAHISRIDYASGACLPSTPIAIAHPKSSQENWYTGARGGALLWPEGQHSVEAFNLQGRKVWSQSRPGEAATLALPTELRAAGLIRLRFTP